MNRVRAPVYDRWLDVFAEVFTDLAARYEGRRGHRLPVPRDAELNRSLRDR
jgi:hypothetical protein